MKIKNDFVTNSSSTSYIISMPENYQIEKQEEKHLEEMLTNFFNILKNEGYVHSGWMSDYDFDVYEDQLDNFRNCISDFLNKIGIIFEFETGSDLPDTIININSKTFKEKMKGMDIHEN